jgi:hypothetical protein
MAGDTFESIAERYLGARAKADDIYNANTAVIPDKTRLKPSIQLAIPGHLADVASCASACFSASVWRADTRSRNDP